MNENGDVTSFLVSRLNQALGKNSVNRNLDITSCNVIKYHGISQSISAEKAGSVGHGKPNSIVKWCKENG